MIRYLLISAFVVVGLVNQSHIFAWLALRLHLLDRGRGALLVDLVFYLLKLFEIVLNGEELLLLQKRDLLPAEDVVHNLLNKAQNFLALALLALDHHHIRAGHLGVVAVGVSLRGSRSL